VTPELAARLQSLEIDWFATEKGYTMFTRGTCAAVAHKREDGFSVGSSGMMIEAGFAYLVWRGEQPYLAAHGCYETAASEEQVAAIRRFAEDLKAALAE
jgi:hypothetical protein